MTAAYQSTESTGPKYEARVNVWDTNFDEGRCGHASVSIVQAGETHKLSKYMGMWPKFGVLVNLFTLPFAVPGTYLKSKKDCMDREGDEGPLAPSRRYTIGLSEKQYSDMKAEMDNESARIKDGLTLYCLFPNFNVVGLAKHLVKPSIMERLHACPFTDMPMEHPQLLEDCAQINQLSTENCTTLTSKLLRAGGIPVKDGSAPFGMSPSQLGDKLDKLAKEHLSQVSRI